MPVKLFGRWTFGVGDPVVTKDGIEGKVVGAKADGFVDVRDTKTGKTVSRWMGNVRAATDKVSDDDWEAAEAR